MLIILVAQIRAAQVELAAVVAAVAITRAIRLLFLERPILAVAAVALKQREAKVPAQAAPASSS